MNKLSLSLALVIICRTTSAATAIDKGSYFLVLEKNFEITIGKKNKNIYTIFDKFKKERLTFNSDKSYLDLYKSNPLGIGLLKSKKINNKYLIGLLLSGPIISFMELSNCKSRENPLNKIKDEVELLNKFDKSCYDKGIINNNFYTQFKSTFNESGVSKCLKALEDPISNILPKLDFNDLVKHFNSKKDVLEKNEEIKIGCFENNDAENKIALVQDNILANGLNTKTIFGYNTKNKYINEKKCQDNISYAAFHETIHLYDKTIKEEKVEEITQKCMEINKYNEVCAVKLSKKNLDEFQIKSACIMGCSGELKEAVKEQLTDQFQQASIAAADRMPASVMENIPTSAHDAMINNPMDSDAFNSGMNLITSSMINKMNIASKVLEQSVQASAPDDNLRIPKINTNNPSAVFSPMTLNQMTSSDDNSRSSLSNGPSIDKNQGSDKPLENPNKGITKKTALTNKNANQGLENKPKAVVLPLVSNTLDFPNSDSGSVNTENSPQNISKEKLGKLNTALNQLLNFKRLEDKELCDELRAAYKNKPQIKGLLKMFDIAIVDKDKKYLFSSSQKPDFVFMDDGNTFKKIDLNARTTK